MAHGIVVSCPGCRRAVSLWAGRCPACATDLSDAVVLEPQDWDTPVARADASNANRPRSLVQHYVRILVGIAISVGLVMAVSAGVHAVGLAARQHPRSSHQVICATPTDSWTPATPTALAAPGAAQVGPLTFRPSYSPGHPDRPTRVIVHAIRATMTALSLTGWGCDTGRPFRFWYPPYGAHGESAPPIGPASTDGSLTVTVPILASGDDFIGYMLFPGPGRWEVEIWDGQALVGNVLFILPG
jgi:hypothetical protein